MASGMGDSSVNFIEPDLGSKIGGDSPIGNCKNLTEDEKIYFKSIFEKYDRDGDGVIDLKELTTMVREDNEVSEKIIKKLMKYSDKNDDGKIDVHEFADMLLDKKFKDLFGHYAKSYVNFIVPRDKRRRFKPIGRSVRSLDEEGITDSEGAYEDSFSCYPPPVCMVLVSIFQLICFFVNRYLPGAVKNDDTTGPIAEVCIYNPERRQEAWRFLTYMVVHIGWVHLTMNMVTQIFLGVALELVNRWYRVLTVYAAGVVAGSLVTSIMDPSVYLAGASGGVYAVITAHLSNIIMNWSEMSYPGVQLFIFVLLISGDVATAIHNRYYLGDQTPIGYAAHFGGALAGFLVGIWVLKNVEPTKMEKYLWWTAFVVYILLMGTAIILNISWTEHFMPTH